MRPDDRFDLGSGGGPADGFGPLDADLEALDGELSAAGAQARRAARAQGQPTRFFAIRLRDRLLAAYPAPAAAALPSSRGSGRSGAPAGRPARAAGIRSELTKPGEAWAPALLQPRISRRTPTLLPRARWAFAAAAMLTGAIAAGVVGARLDWLQPDPTARPSLPAAVVDPTARPSAPAVTGPTASPVLTVPSEPPAGPAATPVATKPTATPRATPRPDPTAKPTPKATTKPEPTKAPPLALDLAVKACPGGVLIDWTKPSPEVGHYHTLRSLGGDVPAAYPGGGTEVESATTFGAGVTDGFDATVAGGDSAAYRTFAFDGGDAVMGYSPSRTVTTVGRIALGTLSATGAGAGSIDVSWGAAAVNAACFSYGKLVASQDDPDPSYLEGASAWAVIDSASTTSVHLDGLPSGKTVWLRYEMLRSTSTGAFVVARTDAVQVTVP